MNPRATKYKIIACRAKLLGASIQAVGLIVITNDVHISFETCGNATSTQVSLIGQCRARLTCLKLFLRLSVHSAVYPRTRAPSWIVLRTTPSPKRGAHRSSQLQPEVRKSMFITATTKVMTTIPSLDRALRATPPNGIPFRKLLTRTH